MSISFTEFEDLTTKCGTKKINADLSNEAKERIKTTIEANDGKIKATFKVEIGDKFADMRIDMVGEKGRSSKHSGARVPHAQIERFTMLIPTNDSKGTKHVPFTSTFDAIELTSDMVLATISNNGKEAAIEENTNLYKAIASTIWKAAKNAKWNKKLLGDKLDKTPEITFTGFASGKSKNNCE